MGPAPSRSNPRTWSDIGGCLFFAGFAVFTAWRIPVQALVLLIPSLLHDLAMAAGFLLRRPLRAQAQGWPPRLAAYAGSFLILGFVALASRYHPQWLAVTPNYKFAAAGFVLWSLGTVLAAWTVWVLRRAFSLEAQARVLLTHGPFRIARHPIYTSYVLQYFGFWLLHDSWALSVVLALWMGITLARIRAEEAVLADTFSEYAAYRERVPAFAFRLPWAGASRRRPAPTFSASAAAGTPTSPISAIDKTG